MALQGIPAGSRYGFVPGSDVAGINMGYGVGYQGIGTLMAPDDYSGYLNKVRGDTMQQDEDLKQQKFNAFKNLLGSFNGNGNDHLQIRGNSYAGLGGGVPPPMYASASPVYSQGQIDAQAGLQRAALLGQAQNNTRQFTQDLGSRGFSPMSPFAMLAGQSNLMRANAGAAQNETQLNFNAAQANSDARLKAAGINAGVYGDYTRALGNQNQLNSQYQLQSQSQHNDLLRMILGGLSA